MPSDLYLIAFDHTRITPAYIQRYFRGVHSIPEVEEFFDPQPTSTEIYSDPTVFHDEVWLGKTLTVNGNLDIQCGSAFTEHALETFKKLGGVAQLDSFIMTDVLNGYRLEADAFLNDEAGNRYKVEDFIFRHIADWCFVDIR